MVFYKLIHMCMNLFESFKRNGWVGSFTVEPFLNCNGNKEHCTSLNSGFAQLDSIAGDCVCVCVCMYQRTVFMLLWTQVSNFALYCSCLSQNSFVVGSKWSIVYMPLLIEELVCSKCFTGCCKYEGCFRVCLNKIAS